MVELSDKPKNWSVPKKVRSIFFLPFIFIFKLIMNLVKFENKKIVLTYENGDTETWKRVNDESIFLGSVYIRHKGELYKKD
jgi:hypothetical protein